MKSKKVIIIGVGETADLAYNYFMLDSDYDVVAFAVDKEYIPLFCKHHVYGLSIYIYLQYAKVCNLYRVSQLFVFTFWFT
jgi:FlaA1/EpsC-like NDP-sugar epimerase